MRWLAHRRRETRREIFEQRPIANKAQFALDPFTKFPYAAQRDRQRAVQNRKASNHYSYAAADIVPLLGPSGRPVLDDTIAVRLLRPSLRRRGATFRPWEKQWASSGYAQPVRPGYIVAGAARQTRGCS